MSEGVLVRWHHVVSTRDPEGVEDLIAEDIAFRSPVVHTPQAGREMTCTHLRAAPSILNDGSFRIVDT